MGCILDTLDDGQHLHQQLSSKVHIHSCAALVT